MPTTNLAKRYAPLAAIIALQLLIVAIVPSKAPGVTDLASGGAGGTEFANGFDNGTGLSPEGIPLDAAGNPIDPNAPGGASGGTAGVGGGGGPGGVGGGGGVGGVGGDISHCKGNRQFDPAIDPLAPPCVPKFTGKNRGATYRGVSETEILIIDYYGQGDPAVDTILRAQGAYASIENRRAFAGAASNFINSHYELWGRKVRIEVFQGRCKTIPPDYTCLRNEAREIANGPKPFAVVWNTSLASPFFAELSAQKVMNLGGWHFTQGFGKAWAPYHLDVQMDGSKIAANAASFFCASVNGHPATYAQGDLKDRPRRLGLISTNDPDNKDMASEYKQAIGRECGGNVAAEYYYAQDISTAGTQVAAFVNKMQSAGVTTVACFCDLVAPQVAMTYSAQFSFYPEWMIVGTGFMDADQAAQAYDKKSFQYAFGTSSIGAQEPFGRDVGSRVWKLGGREGNPPWPAASQLWEYFSLVASSIQAAGTDLTPSNAYAGMQRIPVVPASPTTASRGLHGDYAWSNDARIVYWAPNKPSSFNNEPGTYVELPAGKRFLPGQYPKGRFERP